VRNKVPFVLWSVMSICIAGGGGGVDLLHIAARGQNDEGDGPDYLPL
jgi:hypothetical protein